MNQLRFDGFEINVFEGRISGNFELDDLQAAKLGLDRVVVFVIATRLGKAEVSTSSDGDVKRRNTFTVSEARILEGDQRDQAIRFLAGTQGTLDFGLDDDEDDDDEIDLAEALTNGRRG